MLVVGGSLGAKSVNEAIGKGLEKITGAGLQLIWQTGKPYAPIAKEMTKGLNAVWAGDFIAQMEYAYAAADVVVARAGAMTVAEICVVNRPVLFVPYPFAAEDHQTVNAMQLVNKHAALMVKDSEAKEKLVFMAIELAKDPAKQEEMKTNLVPLSIADADKRIATAIMNMLNG
jgi:UDP-N-acetylglucosamine--N-acetylmuramyl-(pentapeptide) pyrophosphoryl-undecaprenol N-acetylglucosamine transferase